MRTLSLACFLAVSATSTFAFASPPGAVDVTLLQSEVGQSEDGVALFPQEAALERSKRCGFDRLGGFADLAHLQEGQGPKLTSIAEHDPLGEERSVRIDDLQRSLRMAEDDVADGCIQDASERGSEQGHVVVRTLEGDGRL